MPIDNRENVVFLHTFGCADEKSEKIRLAHFSALFQHQFVRADVKNPKPAKSYKQEKEACLDLLIQLEDDQGQILLVNMEMQDTQRERYLSLRSQGYVAQIVVDQLNEGDSIEFHPTVQITLANRILKKQDDDDYLYAFCYCNEVNKIRMPDERCRILWIEMDKLERLESKPLTEWRMDEKIHYMLRFNQCAEKQNIIHELVEKEEIIKMMEEKKMDFLSDTCLAIARIRAKFDEVEYEMDLAESRLQGKLEGRIEGKKMLMKHWLSQHFELSEKEAYWIDHLSEEALLDLCQNFDKAHVSDNL